MGLIMSLKKYLKRCNKVRHGKDSRPCFFYFGMPGQGSLEYFILMATVTLLVVLGGRKLLDNVHTQTAVFTNQAANIMIPDEDGPIFVIGE